MMREDVLKHTNVPPSPRSEQNARETHVLYVHGWSLLTSQQEFLYDKLGPEFILAPTCLPPLAVSIFSSINFTYSCIHCYYWQLHCLPFLGAITYQVRKRL